MKLIFNILTISILFFSCKYEDRYTGDPQPSISKLTLNKSDFKQFTDTVENADSLSVEVKDIRFGKPDYYHLKPLAPLTAKVAISGSVRITLKNIFLLGAGSSESTQFQVRIKDRAQHWSNALTSKSVNINK
jgi:hypothetical protein